MKIKDSPVLSILKEHISFEKNGETAVYLQIAQGIITAIQRGYLNEGTALPGTRIFSKMLQIHRNTAVAVYEEVASQGWAAIIPNKGTFIVIPEPKTAAIKAKYQNAVLIDQYPKVTGFSFQPSFHLAPTHEENTTQYSINDGQPDVRLHPTHQFSKWYSASMKRKNVMAKWYNPSATAYSNFEMQLCNFLNASRSFKIGPQNVMNTRSTEMSLYIISQLLIKPKDTVIVGHLSNYAANMIFQQVGAALKTVPTDENGMMVSKIEEYCQTIPVRCVYICSNREYPTTRTLSPERRTLLLALAVKYGFAIIEDDFDYDFQLEGRAPLPLASSDLKGMVIYLGKLGQSLFPSFQTGFVVAPENLIREAKNYLQIVDKQGDLIQEQMLSELIHEGEVHRLLKKNGIVYKKRRDTLCQYLDAIFGVEIQYEKPSGGLAIWVQFNNQISLVKLAEEAKKKGLFIPKTVLYQDKNTCAIRLGYGHLNEEEIAEVILILKKAYDLVLSASSEKSEPSV